jgi:hypothetical protein
MHKLCHSFRRPQALPPKSSVPKSSAQCAVHSVRCAVKCAVCSVLCVVCGVQHDVFQRCGSTVVLSAVQQCIEASVLPHTVLPPSAATHSATTH